MGSSRHIRGRGSGDAGGSGRDVGSEVGGGTTAAARADRIGLLWESDGAQCRLGGDQTGCRILFSTLPTNF